MTARVRTHHLPALDPPPAAESHRAGAAEIEIPRVTPAELRAALRATKDAARQCLRTRRVDDVLATIDTVISKWLAPDSSCRQTAERLLPAATGFSAPMIRHGIPLMLEPLRGAAIAALLDFELGERGVLDNRNAERHALAPTLITHVLSGNIPGLAAAPMALSLAIKSAALIKSASGDPIFPVLFATSISEVDEVLGRCLLVTYWPGGQRAVEEVAFANADLVVAMGSDAAVAAIARRVPGRFIGHGHRISFAAIAKECLADLETAERLARALAYDVSLWDQQGCLSPQVAYVEVGGRVTPVDFAHLLAEQLARWADELPERALSFDEQAAVLRFRQEAQWRGAEPALLVGVDGTHWTISIEHDSEFIPTCLNRCLRLKIVDSLQDIPAALRLHHRDLEAVGVAVSDHFDDFAVALTACGVHRICPIGMMQRPSLFWRQGGRPRIGEWIEWATIGER